MGARKLLEKAHSVVKTASKVKKVAGKIKREVSAVPKVLKYVGKKVRKASTLKKLALAAAAPLAPLAYGASHGFRKAKQAAQFAGELGKGAVATKVLGKIGGFTAGTAALPAMVGAFHAKSIGEDWNSLKKKAGVK